MKQTLTYGDVQSVLALADNWPEGRVRLVDGDLEIDIVQGGQEELALAAAPSSDLVTSPGVGTFRISSSSGGVPIRAGDKVDAGAVLGTVAALDRATDIVTETGGVLLSVHAGDGEFVQYGQELFVVGGDNGERNS